MSHHHQRVCSCDEVPLQTENCVMSHCPITEYRQQFPWINLLISTLLDEETYRSEGKHVHFLIFLINFLNFLDNVPKTVYGFCEFYVSYYCLFF